MIDERNVLDAIEPERYELFEGSIYNFPFHRRDFIKAFGLGIVFIVPVTRALSQQRGGESGRGGFNERLPNDVGAWIHVDEDGGITVFTAKSKWARTRARHLRRLSLTNYMFLSQLFAS